jgi:hypothetical protein
LTDAHEPIPELDRAGLRRFGLTTGALFAAIFGLFFPWLLDVAFPTWPWVVLVVLGGLALVVPGALRPVYHGWMRLALLLHRVTTPIVLGVIFFAVFTPVALVMKAFGRDELRRRFDAAADSYREPSEAPAEDDLDHPY